MKRNVFAVALFAAAVVLAVACTEKENNTTIDTPVESKAKISRVYSTATMTTEKYNPLNESCETLIDTFFDRRLDMEFFWSGDKLERLVQGVDTFKLFYDNEGRLDYMNIGSHIKFRFHYDAQGHIESYVFMENDSTYTNFVVQDTFVCSYSGDHLVEVNHTRLGTTISEKANDIRYTWEGNNVKQMENIITYVDNDKDTLVQTYSYTNLDSPFHGITILSLFGITTVFSDNYTNEGMNVDWVNGITTTDGESVWSYDYTLSGDRVVKCHELYDVNRPSARSSVIVDYDFEYVK